MTVSSDVARRTTRLQERLTRRFALATTHVMLPKAERRYQIARPAVFDPLLLAAAHDPEEQLPYWALVWPSGIALADMVLARQRELAGRRVLELGCGLGITAAATAAAGATLVVTDYAAAALLLCRLNVLRNTGRDTGALQINWRQPPPALFHHARAGFSHLLAADVLYEERDVAPLLELVERLLVPNGSLWLAEPGRPVAQRFVAAALDRGWHDTAFEHHGPWPEPLDASVVVWVHCLQR